MIEVRKRPMIEVRKKLEAVEGVQPVFVLVRREQETHLILSCDEMVMVQLHGIGTRHIAPDLVFFLDFPGVDNEVDAAFFSTDCLWCPWHLGTITSEQPLKLRMRATSYCPPERVLTIALGTDYRIGSPYIGEDPGEGSAR